MFEFISTIRNKPRRTQTIFSVLVALCITLLIAIPYFHYNYFYEEPVVKEKVSVQIGSGFLASVTEPFKDFYESVSFVLQSMFKAEDVNEYKKKY